MISKPGKILLIGSGLWYLGEGMLGPLFAVFTQRIGGDILEITWAYSAYLIVLGILSVLFGKYSDKWNKEKMMILGYSLNAIFTFCFLLVSNSRGLLLVQVGLGLAAALATPTWQALYSKYTDKKNDGIAWGLSDAVSYMFTGIAIIIGGYIVNYFSFNLLFIIMGILQVIATIYQAKILYCSKVEKIKLSKKG